MIAVRDKIHSDLEIPSVKIGTHSPLVLSIVYYASCFHIRPV